MTRGRLITLEGGEGCGKSTQARRLAQALRDRGHPVLLTREPGGAPGAEAIRALLVEGEPQRWDALTECLLHVAARRDHVERTVGPALERGDWVVSDRFSDSTMAYQGYGQRLGPDPVAALHRLALGTLRPDVTLILDLPAAEGLHRATRRPGSESRYERMDPRFHERVRAGFLEIARREPERCAVIDAGPAEDTVAAAVLATLMDRIGSA